MALHVFQPLPMDVVEINPFKLIGKDWALVTAGSKQKYNTMTVSWGGVGVLWGKNVATIWHDKPFNYEIPVKDGEIIIQGDNRHTIVDILKKEGFTQTK